MTLAAFRRFGKLNKLSALVTFSFPRRIRLVRVNTLSVALVAQLLH
jgi:hypothetical protein